MNAKRTFPLPMIPITLLRRNLLLLSLLLAGASAAMAQGEETRLSWGTLRPDLPPSAQIESAARIGNSVLAAWGTTHVEPDSTIIVRIHTQLLRDMIPRAGRIDLCSKEARPAGFLHVVPLDDRFLVAWRDVRSGAPAIYFRLVDADGNPIGSETLLRDGEWTFGDAGIVWLPGSSRYLLVWADDAARTWTCVIGRDGAMLQSAQRVGNDAEGGEVSLVLLDDHVVVDRAGAPPIIIASDGSELALGHVASRFANPHHLAHDGSLATLAHDTVRIYTSFRDISPARSVVIPFINGAIEGTATLTRDVSGLVRVYYMAGGGRVASMWDRVTAGVIEIGESAPGVLALPVLRMEKIVARGSSNCQRITADPREATITRLGVSHFRVSVRFDGVELMQCPGVYSPQPYRRDVGYEVDGDGLLLDTLPRPSPPAPASVQITRVASLEGSAVEITVDSVTTRLSAVSAMRSVAMPATWPGVMEDRGAIRTGWIMTDESGASAMLGVWRGGSTQRVEPLPSLRILGAQQDTSAVGSPITTHEMIPLDGEFLLSTHHHWTPANNVPSHHLLALYAPTASGWREVHRADTSIAYGTMHRLATGYNRFNGEVITAWTFTPSLPSSSIHIDAVDTSGKMRWSNASLPLYEVDTLRLAPWDTNAFVIALPQMLMNVRNDSMVASKESLTPFAGKFYATVARQLLQVDPVSDIGVIILTLYDRRAFIRAAQPVRLTESVAPENIFVAQNPIDQTIHLLLAGEDGVRLYTLDNKLRLLDGPTAVGGKGHRTKHPAAVCRNDTLFVVWEDHRDSIPAIYGRALMRPLRLGVESALAGRSEGSAITAVIPNPARDLVSAHYAGVRSGAVAEVTDLLGVVRMNIPVDGGGSVSFSVAGLPEGSYLLRLRDGSSSATARFVVIR